LGEGLIAEESERNLQDDDEALCMIYLGFVSRLGQLEALSTVCKIQRPNERGCAFGSNNVFPRLEFVMYDVAGLPKLNGLNPQPRANNESVHHDVDCKISILQACGAPRTLSLLRIVLELRDECSLLAAS